MRATELLTVTSVCAPPISNRDRVVADLGKAIRVGRSRGC